MHCAVGCTNGWRRGAVNGQNGKYGRRGACRFKALAGGKPGVETLQLFRKVQATINPTANDLAYPASHTPF